jgi:uracil-DNA glycosylase
VIVALGATAIQSVTGERLKVGDARHLPLLHASGEQMVATYHPSAVLRARDKGERARMYAALVADLGEGARRPRYFVNSCIFPRSGSVRVSQPLTSS